MDTSISLHFSLSVLSASCLPCALLFLYARGYLRPCSIQPILISRFLLNLRQVDAHKGPAEAASLSSFSVPNFRIPTIHTFVGNMGEPLEYEAPNSDERSRTTERTLGAEELPELCSNNDIREVSQPFFLCTNFYTFIHNLRFTSSLTKALLRHTLSRCDIPWLSR